MAGYGRRLVWSDHWTRNPAPFWSRCRTIGIFRETSLLSPFLQEGRRLDQTTPRKSRHAAWRQGVGLFLTYHLPSFSMVRGTTVSTTVGPFEQKNIDFSHLLTKKKKNRTTWS